MIPGSGAARAWASVAAFALACALALLAMQLAPVEAAPAAAASSGVSQVISQAEFCQAAGMADTMPANCRWTRVTLAKRWRPAEPVGLCDAWYRLHFHLDSVPDRSLAMYMVAFNRTDRSCRSNKYL